MVTAAVVEISVSRTASVQRAGFPARDRLRRAASSPHRRRRLSTEAASLRCVRVSLLHTWFTATRP